MTTIKSVAKRLPVVRKVVEHKNLQSELLELKKHFRFAPPGHYYSPIPSMEDIARRESGNPDHVQGIDLRESDQLRLIETFVDYYREMPFQPHKVDGLRYYFENQSYSYSDAIFLHCMIRHLKPQRIIEVGSGFSSCVTLDTNELFFDNRIFLTFIEPYPELLLSLLSKEDRDRLTILPVALQDVDGALFSTLAENDILFIDSTHVSKVSSDVNRVFFEILPRLNPGVYVHFHDIFYPFEYPEAWFLEGRAWNEAYLLRAFLQYNAAFEVMLMNTFAERFHRTFFQKNLPLCLKNEGGSIWIRKML